MFYTHSGLKINLEKSIIIPMGRCRNKPLKLPKELHKLKFSDGAFKTLGVWFANDQEEMTKLNFENKLKGMEKIMNIWTSRNLSLKGKVTIIKSLLLPQICHLLSMCYCPQTILDRANRMLFSFLLNKKPPKIKKETVIANF